MSTSSPPRSACLDPAILAAFVDNRLEQATRSTCESHMAECPHCYEAFVETVKTLNAVQLGQEQIAPTVAAGKYRRHVVCAIAGALAAMLAIAVLTDSPRFGRESELDRAMRELVLAVGANRPTVARLTAPFPWSPPPAALRGADGPELAPEATIAAAKIMQSTQTDRNANSLQALGTAQLVLGRIDSAVSALEEAARLAPDIPTIWVDLSAAYYERSATSDAAINLPKGLEAVNTAIELGGADVPAWFNKALLLERLNTREQAAAAWRRYLQLDSESPWAEEARQHLGELERKKTDAATAPDAQRQRDSLLDQLLVRWAGNVLQRNSAAAVAALAEARRLADEISDSASDRLAGDVVGSIADSSPTVSLRLAAGHAAYGEARAMYARNDYEGAALRFAHAQQHFDQVGSPAGYLTRLNAATVRFRLNDLPSAVAALSALRDASQARRYPSVAGRAAWVEGLALELSGFAHEATDRYTAATRLLHIAAEHGNAAFVEGLLASQLDRLGNPDEAWNIWVKCWLSR